MRLPDPATQRLCWRTVRRMCASFRATCVSPTTHRETILVIHSRIARGLGPAHTSPPAAQHLENPANAQFRQIRPVGLYLVDTRARAPDPLFGRGLI